MPVTIGEVQAEVTPENRDIPAMTGAVNGSMVNPDVEVRKVREIQNRIQVRDARLRAE